MAKWIFILRVHEFGFALSLILMRHGPWASRTKSGSCNSLTMLALGPLARIKAAWRRHIVKAPRHDHRNAGRPAFDTMSRGKGREREAKRIHFSHFWQALTILPLGARPTLISPFSLCSQNQLMHSRC